MSMVKKGQPESVSGNRGGGGYLELEKEVLGVSKLDKVFFRNKEKMPSKAKYKVYFFIIHNLEYSCHNSLPPE